MTMEIVEKQGNRYEPVMKQMDQMMYGEICYHLTDNIYILKATYTEEDKQTWIKLQNIKCKNNISRYSANKLSESWPHWASKVRELYPGESITIKFS